MRKVLGRKAYGSIGHLSNSKLGSGDRYINHGQERIATEKTRDKHDLVLVTEKLDGSNVAIAKLRGEIYALTRAGYSADTSPYEQHHIFSKWVQDNNELFKEHLREGQSLHGEWLLQVHSLDYGALDSYFFAFDLMQDGERLPWLYLQDFCDDTGLQTVPLLSAGPPKKPLFVFTTNSLINPMVTAEGVVYRVERKGKVDFLAKWVRPDFEPGKFMKDEILHKI